MSCGALPLPLPHPRLLHLLVCRLHAHPWWQRARPWRCCWQRSQLPSQWPPAHPCQSTGPGRVRAEWPMPPCHPPPAGERLQTASLAPFAAAAAAGPPGSPAAIGWSPPVYLPCQGGGPYPHALSPADPPHVPRPDLKAPASASGAAPSLCLPPHAVGAAGKPLLAALAAAQCRAPPGLGRQLQLAA